MHQLGIAAMQHLNAGLHSELKELEATMKEIDAITMAPSSRYNLNRAQQQLAQGAGLGDRGAGNTYHNWSVNIHNPVPEPAGPSIVRTMQKIRYHGITPIESWGRDG
jgi:hypothetical protein